MYGRTSDPSSLGNFFGNSGALKSLTRAGNQQDSTRNETARTERTGVETYSFSKPSVPPITSETENFFHFAAQPIHEDPLSEPVGERVSEENLEQEEEREIAHSLEREPPPSFESTHFVSYAHKIIPSDIPNFFQIMHLARSLDGAHRHQFIELLTDKTLLSFPFRLDSASPEEEIDRILRHLKANIPTQEIEWDPDAKMFLVDPSNKIPARILESADRVIKVPQLTFSNIAAKGHRFFTLFNTRSNEWVADSPIDHHYYHTPFRIATLQDIDPYTVALSLYGSSFDPTIAPEDTPHTPFSPEPPTVLIWTARPFSDSEEYAKYLVTTFSRDCSESSYLEVLPHITIRSFSNSAAKRSIEQTKNELLSHLFKFIQSEVDLLFEFGTSELSSRLSEPDEVPAAKSISYKLLKLLSQYNHSHGVFTQVINLREYLSKVYPYLASCALSELVSRVNLTPAPLKSEKVNRFSANLILYGIQSRYLTEHHKAESFYSEADWIPHGDTEWLMKYAALKSYSMSRLLAAHFQGMLNLVQLSGCGFGELCNEEKLAKGIVTFINPVAAVESFSTQFRGAHDPGMKTGVTKDVAVVSYADLLYNDLLVNNKELAEILGGVKYLGWPVIAVCELLQYSFPAIPFDYFGYHRGMIYTWKEELGEFAGVENGVSSLTPFSLSPSIPSSPLVPLVPLAEWDFLIAWPDFSWMGINKNSTVDRLKAHKEFGNFGGTNLNSPPFLAHRKVVEMYVGMMIQNVNLPIEEIVTSIQYDTKNMVQRMLISAFNFAEQSELLTSTEIELFSGKDWFDEPPPIEINTYHTATSITRNFREVDAEQYQEIITESVKILFFGLEPIERRVEKQRRKKEKKEARRALELADDLHRIRSLEIQEEENYIPDELENGLEKFDFREEILKEKYGDHRSEEVIPAGNLIKLPAVQIIPRTIGSYISKKKNTVFGEKK